jgi:hypothetical protein
MKILLIILGFFICSVTYGQTPSQFLKMVDDETAFGQNIPQGSMLTDMKSFKRYIVLKPLSATKTIKNCVKLLLDESHVMNPDGSVNAVTATAEIKEIGANSSSHYIGEIITTDDPALTTDDGLAIAIWTEGGVETVLLLALQNAGNGAWDGTTGTPLASQGWRLPTIFELNVCLNSVTIINTILGEANGFVVVDPVTLSEADPIGIYWSSSEPVPGAPATGSGYYKNFKLNATGTKVKSTSYSRHYVRIHQ